MMSGECDTKVMPDIYGHISLVDKIHMFQQQADQHKKKQLENPFSEWEGSTHAVKLDKHDPNYGRPVPGSKTEKRGLQASALICSETIRLCEVIRDYGLEVDDGGYLITFGELFQLYTAISSKVVGILLRARKHGLVEFEGEMLFQRRDDNVMIKLIKTPSGNS